MLQRGRKSAESLAVLATFPCKFAAPPADLTQEQAEVWAAVVATKPMDWWGADTYPLLAAYCRAVIEHRWISAQVDAKKDEWLEDPDGLKLYDCATRLQERQARMMASLATKMRLTQHSQVRQHGAGRKAQGGGKPWGVVIED